MVILTLSDKYKLKEKEVNSFIQAVRAVFPGDISIFLRYQMIAPKVRTYFEEEHLFGKDHIKEKINLENCRQQF